MKRRAFFGTAAAAAAGSLTGTVHAAAPPSLKGPYLDLSTGKGNMLMLVRMGANLDETKTKYGTATGIVSGVRPGEKVRDLFGFEVLGVARAEKQSDDSYRLYHREVVYYTDLASGEILNEYTNPYTNERVKVVDVINDPWNEYFEEFEPRMPSYGGLNSVSNEPRKPNLLNWSQIDGGMIVALKTFNLFYPSALKPEQWPRESAGTMNQVSECYTYMVKLEDAQNPKVTSLSHTGTWSRVTPWLPWMLMGQAPGHVIYQSIVASHDDIGGIKKTVREHAEKYHPQMLVPPPKESWSQPNLSSLEVYAKTQKPAPAVLKR